MLIQVYLMKFITAICILREFFHALRQMDRKNIPFWKCLWGNGNKNLVEYLLKNNIAYSPSMREFYRFIRVGDRKRRGYIQLNDTKETFECLDFGSYNYNGTEEGFVIRDEYLDDFDKITGESSIAKKGLSAIQTTLQQWTQKPIVECFNTGYMTNMEGVAYCIFSSMDLLGGMEMEDSNKPKYSLPILICSDETNHHSIVSGIARWKNINAESNTQDYIPFEMMILPHNQLGILSDRLSSCKDQYSKVFLFVEGLYSMKGTFCDVESIVSLKKQYGEYLITYVDEAHSFASVLGGSVFHQHPECVDYLVGTFSKCFSSQGGFIASYYGNSEKYLVGYPSLRKFHPLMIIQIQNSMMYYDRDDTPRRLYKLSSYLRELLIKGKIPFQNTLGSPVFMIPVGGLFFDYQSWRSPFRNLFMTDRNAFGLHRKLLRIYRIFVPFIYFPAVPIQDGPYFRICLSANHSLEDLSYLACCLELEYRE
jgi:7-keto-8-aminopelargonate synthetase-like enzyme